MGDVLQFKPRPRAPALEGFETLLDAGAAGDTADGILTALDGPDVPRSRRRRHKRQRESHTRAIGLAATGTDTTFGGSTACPRCAGSRVAAGGQPCPLCR